MNFNTTHEKNTFFTHLFFVFLFYILGDIYTTHYAITNGFGTEYNLLASTLLNFTHGFVWLFLIKVIFLIFLAYVSHYLLLKNYKKTYTILMYYVILLGIATIISNTCVILTGETMLQYIPKL